MKEKILQLLNENNYTSGEQIAKQLRLSRTAVWKQIQNLKKNGYKIEAVKNRGYKLISKPDTPFPEEIKYDLQTKIIGKKIIYLNIVDSTNSYAKKLIRKNIDEGTVVIAEVQTKGRGRKNRKWFSPEGGLWFSIILYPNIPPYHSMLVTMTVSTSIAYAVKKTIGVKPVIKWPNDLLINNKKVCGVLTELDAEMDKINYCVVGVGINVNNEINDEIKDIATSLCVENNDTPVSRVELLKQILCEFDKNYHRLKQGDNIYIRDLWFSFSNIIGKKIRVMFQNNVVEGIVSDVDDMGCLIVNTSKGDIIRIVTGDVSYL
ncbi:MAG: biotin--[acetyl-CoA-carboxylase] ligase [Thermoplasmata archaeon]|nr:MAG: biotin--[acetyl-CoA-carboxylase] ligase [Thermoplasmata archaeon]